MKTAASILIFFAVLIQLLSRLAIYASFKINQDFIAKNICVEREVPESTCQGSCQLMKQLKQQEEKEQEMPINIGQKEITLFDKDNQDIYHCIRSCILKLTYGLLKEASTQSFIPIIFHPPQMTHKTCRAFLYYRPSYYDMLNSVKLLFYCINQLLPFLNP